MVDPHHRAPAQPNQRDQGGQIRPVGPHVKDTNFSLGGSERGVNDRYERDSFLEQIVGAFGRRNGGELRVGGGELDPLTREGEERFQDDAVAVPGKAVAGSGVAEPVIEKDGGGNGGVVEEGNGEFADVEVPVRVAGPFHIERLPIVEL
jgi:hypothetical protein